MLQRVDLFHVSGPEGWHFWRISGLCNWLPVQPLGSSILDQITLGLLNACKAAVPHFSNPKSLVRHQLQSAIAMAESGHVPRRPLSEVLQREAAAAGAPLDAESLEQAS